MRYQETLNYLYGLRGRGIKLGLTNTEILLRYFGNPQLKIPTIHIAGTNGKGSTAAFAQSILSSAGYRAGLYTSPHLLDFRERIRIDRRLIDLEELQDLVLRIKSASEKLNVPVTFFEFTTVMAFLYFFEQQAEINVIEVGLGGRLDATNLCRAELSIITSISVDHTEYLGPDLLKIAGEKASIIKEKGTIFADIEDDRVFNKVTEAARKKSARLLRSGKDFHGNLKFSSFQSQTMDFSSEGGVRIPDLKLSLIGRHQVSNASLALAACLELAQRGWNIPETALREGLKDTQWEGRMEVAGRHPTVILDCAHNPDAARKLTVGVRELFSYKRCLLILGIMKGKPIDEMLEIFSGLAHHLILVKPNQERSEDPKYLKSGLQKQPVTVDIIEPISAAVPAVRQMADADDLICITGSIFTVAEAKQSLIHEENIKNNSYLLGPSGPDQ